MPPAYGEFGDHPSANAQTIQPPKADASLVPAIQELHGLLYYHVAVDPTTSTVVNVSWESIADAIQMETLPSMLAQRPRRRRIRPDRQLRAENPDQLEIRLRSHIF
jgi:hypothetical protein